MEELLSWLHFPLDIQLAQSPLLEAWLEIRWKIEAVREPVLMRDPGFPYALGVFYRSIQDAFPDREQIGPHNVPQEMLPHVVQYRFREDKDKWPVLQLGPGVATVNFTAPYTWDLFMEKALYLREKLLDAYGEQELKVQSLALRYRNGVPFECETSDPLQFFGDNLNTSVTLPEHIPGPVSNRAWPVNTSMDFTFSLSKPRGTGILRLGTGTLARKEPETGHNTTREMLMWQLEIISGAEEAPELDREDRFALWLTLAHAVIHEWFFSLVAGPLRKRYEER